MSRRVLMIEDDSSMFELVSDNLKELNCRIEQARDGVSGLARALEDGVELVILDLGLPELDGLEVCSRLRQQRATLPILIVSSRSDEIDRILGLELGADDYLVKPFHIRELVARVRALFRRVDALQSAAPATKPLGTLRFEKLEIDLLKRRVLYDGMAIHFTAVEFDLLLTLASNPGKPFSREELANQVMGYAVGDYEATINTHFCRIRRKIEPDADNPRFILTVRSIGYRFADLEQFAG